MWSLREVLITDNHPLNLRLFKLFSSDKNTLAPVVPHQLVQTENSLFCLILYIFSNRYETTGLT